MRSGRRAPEVGEHDAEVLAEPARLAAAVVRDPAPARGRWPACACWTSASSCSAPRLARLFCDQGAEVIKIESRAFPDGARVSPAHFAIGHRGSRSLGVNLRSPEGVDVVERLVARSDVLLANFKPGTLEKLGLGARGAAGDQPGDRRRQQQRGRGDRPVEHVDGLRPARALRVRADQPLAPSRRRGGFGDSTTIHPDHYAARVTAIAALAALIARRRSGRGAEIATSQAETILMQIGTLLVEEALRPGAIQATGNVGRHAAPWGVYPCAGDDEWCAVTVRDDDDWRRLRGALGDPDWAADDDLATTAGRLARRAEIDEQLTAWTRARPPREVTATLQAAGVPAGFMQRAAEYQDDPQLQARDFFRTFEQPGLEPIRVENAPFRSERIPVPATSARARARGAHARDLHRVARHGRGRGRPPDRRRRARGAGAVRGPWAACAAQVTTPTNRNLPMAPVYLHSKIKLKYGQLGAFNEAMAEGQADRRGARLEARRRVEHDDRRSQRGPRHLGDRGRQRRGRRCCARLFADPAFGPWRRGSQSRSRKRSSPS